MHLSSRALLQRVSSLFSFPFSVLLLFLMNWSSLREEGLLVSLEGEGGELVPYSSLQECAIWFENGEPCHTLSCSFHASVRARKRRLPLSPAAPPSLRHSLLRVRLPSDLTAEAVAGSNDVCMNAGQKGGAQKSNFSP